PPGRTADGRRPRRRSAGPNVHGSRPARARAAARRRTSRDHRLHGTGEPLPLVAACGQLGATAAREAIHATRPGVALRPRAREQPGALEAVERRVDGALGEPEDAAASLLQPLDHEVAVRRVAIDRRQDEQIQMPTEYLATHTL